MSVPGGTAQSERRSPLLYFAYSGLILVVTMALTLIVRLRLGQRGWMFTWQLIGVAAVTFGALIVLALRRYTSFFDPIGRLPFWDLRLAVDIRSDGAVVPAAGFLTPRMREIAANIPWLGSVAMFVAAVVVLTLDHRWFVAVLAAAQTYAITSLRPGKSRWTFVSVGLLSLFTWSLAAGVSYTHLGDLLMSADPVAGAALAVFVGAFALVLFEFDADGRRTRRLLPVAALVAFFALAVFACAALRTDNLVAEWVPIHRSYFADVAQYVKDGHRLLWDVPSLYGFLSILTIASIPAADGWQAVYELTALFLTVQCFIVFVILRWNRSGFANLALSLLLPLAAFGESIARYPWSGRLYPQGGLRFFWLIVLLFVMFAAYVCREHPRRVASLRYAGHAVWLTAVLWSFENALWVSVVWFAYLAADAVVAPQPVASISRLFARLARRAWPVAVLPVVAVAVIELVYRRNFGIVPDWRAYAEFTGLFTSGKVRSIFFVQPFGAGWAMLLVAAATGTLGLVALLTRRLELLKLLLGAWLAVWAASTYFAVEPLDEYVALIMAVLVTALAIALFAAREMTESRSAYFARLSLAPLAIVVLTTAFGAPERLAAMHLPLSPGWSFSNTKSFPVISGELGALMSRAGVRSGDAVLLPNGPYWTELKQGLILPFGRGPGGVPIVYHSWMPTSPVGPADLFDGLDRSRQRVYKERFLARFDQGGWYMTYRSPANCRALSDRLVAAKRVSSPNFSAVYCQIVRPARAAGKIRS